MLTNKTGVGVVSKMQIATGSSEVLTTGGVLTIAASGKPWNAASKR